MKSTDFPSHLKEVGQFFVKHAYQFDAGTLFADLIDYITCCTLYQGEPETRDRLMKHYKEHYKEFATVYHDILKALHNQLETNKWYDILGEIYEICAASSKKSRLGQFFTPHEVCEMMAEITAEKGKAVSGMDPASGSGRTIISVAMKCHPDSKWYGADLDPICAKMTAINMAWHGISGKVWCGDTLMMKTNFGYHVNPWPNLMMRIPHLLPCHEPMFVAPKGSQNENTSELEEAQSNNQQPKQGQLTLF